MALERRASLLEMNGHPDSTTDVSTTDGPPIDLGDVDLRTFSGAQRPLCGRLKTGEAVEICLCLCLSTCLRQGSFKQMNNGFNKCTRGSAEADEGGT